MVFNSNLSFGDYTANASVIAHDYIIDNIEGAKSVWTKKNSLELE